MSGEPSEGTTIRLGHGDGDENVIALRYGPDLLSELDGMAKGPKSFDVIVINAERSGFLFPAEVLADACAMAPNLLNMQGALVFVKGDKSVVFIRESLMGPVACHVFRRHAELYDYSPTLARHARSCLGKDSGLVEESTDLSHQILMSSAPVLTQFGIKLKAGMESTPRRNIVLGAIDNYTPLSTIQQRLTEDGKMSRDELMEELKSLEQCRAIYPVLPKVPFLVHCLKNKIAFDLRDYMLSSRLLTQEQLDEVTFEQQNSSQGERLSLGPIAVSKGIISARQLEIAMQDQAFYGQKGDGTKSKSMSLHTGESSLVQSMVGHLGTTEPAVLLQNLASTRESGILSVEHRDLQFRAQYEKGSLLNAKVGRLKGNNAILEFVSAWEEGIFVFIERQAPPDLTQEACRITKPLDKLLLDAALAKDNQDAVWNKLPHGINSVLERVPDSKGLLAKGEFKDPKEGFKLKPAQVQHMRVLWDALYGLTPIATTIANLGDITTSDAAYAIGCLLHNELVAVPPEDTQVPLDKFQQIVEQVGQKIGPKRNLALLRLSLQDSQGYSARARMFSIGSAGEVGIDISAAKSAEVPLSELVKALEDWQVKFIERASEDLDKGQLRDIVYKVHQKS